MKRSSDITVIKELLHNDRQITIRKTVARTDWSYGTVFNILHEKLNMGGIFARWIPIIPTRWSDQKWTWQFEHQANWWNLAKCLYTWDQASINLLENPCLHYWRSSSRASPPKSRCSFSSLTSELWSRCMLYPNDRFITQRWVNDSNNHANVTFYGVYP